MTTVHGTKEFDLAPDGIEIADMYDRRLEIWRVN